MKDWKNLIPDKTEIVPAHYTAGRYGQKVNKVVIHHNAAANQSLHDVVTTWQVRPASAHYQVEKDGTIGQAVYDGNTAWHAGNLSANLTSIGIEHTNSGGPNEWPISEATRESGAHLVAALCRYYGLGRPQWGRNVFPHQYFSSTACPWALANAYRDAYMKRAGEWYDAMAAGKAAPATTATAQKATPAAAPAKAAVAKTKTDKQNMLTVDGVQGTATQARLEQVMGVKINGVDEAHEPAFEALQKWLNTVVSRQDIKNLTGKPQLETDGVAGSATWRVFQYVAWNLAASYVKTLPTGKSFGTFVDGVAGPDTIKALQWMLNNSYANSGKLLSR